MNSSKQAKLEDIKAVVKSIVIPYKEGVGIFEIQKDYKELEGRPLPYSEFGYGSPRDFLASMSDILTSGMNRFNESIYRARFGEATSHIQEMVMGQKTVTKKRKKRPAYSGYSNYYGGARLNVRPSASWGSNWGRPARPFSGGGGPSIRNRPLFPAGYDVDDDSGPHYDDTFIYHPPSNPSPIRPPRPNIVNIPRQPPPLNNHVQRPKTPFQPSQVNNTQPKGLVSNRPLAGPANNARATAPFLSANDIKNIKDLLKRVGSEGINIGLFQLLHEKIFGLPLDPHARGFSDLQHALSSIKHICSVELHPSNKYYVVKLVDVPMNSKVEGINGAPKSPKRSPRRSPRNSPKNSPEKSPQSANKPNGRLGPAANETPHRKVVSSIDNPYEMQIEVQNGYDDSEALENFPKNAISYFKSILEKHPYGISAENFLDEYENLCGASLEPTNWGYFSLIEIFYGLPSLFFVDPADSRCGKDDEQDVIYDAKKVPPEVRSRVTEYHVRHSNPIQNDAQIRWCLKLKLMALLMKATEGISVENFSTDYYLNFKESLDPCLYNYSDFKDMFENLSKELPIQLVKSYSGDDLSVSLTNDWQSSWIDICVANKQYDALKQMVVPENVMLPGDNIPDVDVDPATVDSDVWHPIILTSVVNPNCIFVNLFGKYYSEALDGIMSKLNFYATSHSKGFEVPSYCLREDLFCVAPFDVDNSYHRVKIVKVEPDRKRVRIAFIDYGGEQLIESSKLRLMKKEYSYLPAQAIRLSLRGIRPKTDKWPSNAKNEILAFMHRAMNRKDNILCRLHSRRSPHIKESVRYEAEICDKTTVGFIFLHKQLIESGLAIIDEVNATTQNSNEVLIPNNDVHRPLRKQTRVAAKKMIATLKNLKSVKAQTSEESTDCDTHQSQSSSMNGDTPNGSFDHSNNLEAKNLADEISSLNINKQQ